MEFREHNVEFGYTYTSDAVVADGSPEPVPVDAICVYEPCTRPGAPLPHAWAEDAHDGARRALLDLARPGEFLLIAGEDGADWCEAARQIATDYWCPTPGRTRRPRGGRLPRRALRLDSAALVPA